MDEQADALKLSDENPHVFPKVHPQLQYRTKQEMPLPSEKPNEKDEKQEEMQEKHERLSAFLRNLHVKQQQRREESERDQKLQEHMQSTLKAEDLERHQRESHRDKREETIEPIQNIDRVPILDGAHESLGQLDSGVQAGLEDELSRLKLQYHRELESLKSNFQEQANRLTSSLLLDIKKAEHVAFLASSLKEGKLAAEKATEAARHASVVADHVQELSLQEGAHRASLLEKMKVHSDILNNNQVLRILDWCFIVIILYIDLLRSCSTD